jgi:hypothetical protein
LLTNPVSLPSSSASSLAGQLQHLATLDPTAIQAVRMFVKNELARHVRTFVEGEDDLDGDAR